MKGMHAQIEYYKVTLDKGRLRLLNSEETFSLH